MPKNGAINTSHIRSFVPAIFVLLVFGVTFASVINGLIGSWGNSEDNSHGFLIFPIFLYMLWQKRTQLADTPIEGSNVGGFFFFLSLVIFILAEAGGILSLASLSFWFVFVSGIWFLFGSTWIKNMAFPLVFLLFMFPVPSQIYAAATGPLQLFVSQVSCFLLKASHVPIICQGNVIEHPEQTFQVVQACSGLRSIMTMLTLGAIVAYFAVTKYWLRVLLLLSGIPIAILVNIFRVYVLVGLYEWLQLDLTSGTEHTLLGIGVFVLSLGLFFVLYKGVSRWDR